MSKPFVINPKFRLHTPHLCVRWIMVDESFLDRESACFDMESVCVFKQKVQLLYGFDGHDIEFFYAPQTDLCAQRVQSWLRLTMKKIIYETAEKILPSRLHELEIYSGLKASAVEVKKLRGAYGCCYCGPRIIHLHPLLVLSPQQFIDEVILHELTHILYPHHRKSFWEHLSKLTGHDAKKVKRIDDMGMSRSWEYCKFLLK